jgi:hypothetical protein
LVLSCPASPVSNENLMVQKTWTDNTKVMQTKLHSEEKKHVQRNTKDFQPPRNKTWILTAKDNLLINSCINM